MTCGALFLYYVGDIYSAFFVLNDLERNKIFMDTTVTPVTKRLRYLDAAKGWGILMVVFGHITMMGNPVDTWFASYKLAIFYIVSGYLLCMRQTFRRLDFKSYFVKQIKSMMVPYFGYSAIVILYNILLCLMKGRSGTHILHKFLEQLYATCTLRGISALWFLPSIFIGQILFFLIIKSPRWVRVISAVIVPVFVQYFVNLLPVLEESLSGARYKIVLFPILTVNKGLVAFWFIGAGYICYLLLSRVKKRNLRFLIGVVLFAADIYLSQINPGVNLNLLKVGIHPALFYFNGIIASIGTVLILEYLEKWWKMTFLNFCGKYSLVIMATHGTLGFKVLIINGWNAVYTLAEEPGLRYYLECTGTLLELMLLECGVIQIVENYFPVLMGKPRKKEEK